MKLNVKELQVLDSMLHAYSYLSFEPEETKKFMMIVKIDNKLIQCNFLQFQKDYLYPVQSNASYTGVKGYKRISNNSLFEYFVDIIQADLNGYGQNLNKFINTSDLLIDKLSGLITKEKLDQYPDYENNKIYNVNFIEFGTRLDFYFIDPSQEYELVSITLESEN